MAANMDQLREELLPIARRFRGAAADAVIDASGVVQQTFLEAHRSGALETLEEWQLRAWLRTALGRNLRDAADRAGAAKRDAARTLPLPGAVDSEGGAAGDAVAAPYSSPSEQAARNEDLGRMEAALGALPPRQRRAVELHYLKKQSVAEVAADLGVSPAAAGGLLCRGMAALRSALGPMG